MTFTSAETLQIMDWFFVFIARTLTSRSTLDRGKTMNKIAIIQRPPVLLNCSATLAVAIESVGEAAAAGAKLIVLPENFIPGYPSWIWRLAPGRDGALIAELHARLLANAVDLATGDLDALCEVARGHRVTVRSPTTASRPEAVRQAALNLARGF
jgi:predicted amidohydrolase